MRLEGCIQRLRAIVRICLRVCFCRKKKRLSTWGVSTLPITKQELFSSSYLDSYWPNLKWHSLNGSFMSPRQTGSPAVLCSTHPFPHWRMPAQSLVQTSGFSWFLSYPPWFNLLASVFCFVQCLLKILNYHPSYLQIVSHCARWTQKSLVPTRIYSQWLNKTTRITMGLCFNLTWRVPALFRPAVKWDPPRFKWRPGFSWAHESFENAVFCWLRFSSVKSNQSINSELREEWT